MSRVFPRSVWLRFALATAFLAGTMLTAAEDWPTYLHDVQRQAAGGETFLSTTNAGQLAPLWSFQTGGIVGASPAVVNNVVYEGSWDGYEYALNATNGQLLWKTYLGITNAPGCVPPTVGVDSSAAVQDGVVYVGGGGNEAGGSTSYWYALDAATGSVLWKVPIGDNSATGGNFNWSSPLLYNGYAYIGVASLGDCPLVAHNASFDFGFLNHELGLCGRPAAYSGTLGAGFPDAIRAGTVFQSSNPTTPPRLHPTKSKRSSASASAIARTSSAKASRVISDGSTSGFTAPLPRNSTAAHRCDCAKSSS